MRETPVRTQAARSDATVTALVATARGLFGAEGYAAVSTAEVARRAGVSKGALYHQFPSKSALFEAVVEDIEAEVAAEVAVVLSTDGPVIDRLHEALDLFLRLYNRPDVQRTVLIDGPSVLGWQRWRALCLEHASGALLEVLDQAESAGLLKTEASQVTVHLLLGAIDEAALLIAHAIDPVATRSEVVAALMNMFSRTAT